MFKFTQAPMALFGKQLVYNEQDVRFISNHNSEPQFLLALITNYFKCW